jgi:hypothetical protein
LIGFDPFHCFSAAVVVEESGRSRGIRKGEEKHNSPYKSDDAVDYEQPLEIIVALVF